MKFLADENFDGTVYRGLVRHLPALDLVRVQDVGLATADDPSILDWAAQEERVLLTHDRRTMPGYAYQRIAEGKQIAGMIVMKPNLSVGQVIADIELIEACSTSAEWINKVIDLPL